MQCTYCTTNRSNPHHRLKDVHHHNRIDEVTHHGQVAMATIISMRFCTSMSIYTPGNAPRRTERETAASNDEVHTSISTSKAA